MDITEQLLDRCKKRAVDGNYVVVHFRFGVELCPPTNRRNDFIKLLLPPAAAALPPVSAGPSQCP